MNSRIDSFEVHENGGVIVWATSCITGKRHSMRLPFVEAEQMEYLISGPPPIQERFAKLKLSSDEREFIATGIPREEWRRVIM